MRIHPCIDRNFIGYVVLATILSRICTGYKSSESVPLMSQRDESLRSQKQLKNQLTPGCWFGEQWYELQQSWHPVLEPMGEMVCIICTCHPVFKKGRLDQTGNVDCQNIADTCPRVQCPDAVLLPGECCKSCPDEAEKKPSLPNLGGAGGFALFGGGGMTEDASLAMGDQAPDEPKEFLVLLSGRGQLVGTRTRAAGSARLTLVAPDLTYTLQLSRAQSAATLRFVEEQGTVLHEIVLPSQQTGKICGTWMNIPRIYIGYLLTKKIHLVVTSKGQANGEMSGPVLPHRAIQQETWSVVLSPERRDGSAALTILTLEQNRNLAFLMLHSGLSHTKHERNVTLAFLRRRKVITSFDVTLSAQESETGEVWMRPSRSVLKSLVRGRLHMEVRAQQHTRMRGEIGPRLTCSKIHGILSSQVEYVDRKQKKDSGLQDSPGKNAFFTLPRKNEHGGSGRGAAITLSLSDKGKLNYEIKLNDIDEVINKVEVKEESFPSRNTKAICRLSGRNIQNSGSCGTVQASEVHALFHNRFVVTAETTNPRRAHLLGVLQKSVFTEPSNSLGVELVMTGNGMQPPVATNLVAHAWLSVTGQCDIYFSVVLAASSPDITWTPFLRDRQNDHVYLSTVFTEHSTSSRFTDLPKELFQRLNVGLVIFGISTINYPDGEISSNVTLPSRCGEDMWKQRPLRDSEHNEGQEDEQMSSLPSADNVQSINQCTANGVTYESGSTWIPPDDECSTCSCSRGQKHCQQVLCPPLQCLNPIRIPGDCCQYCPVSSSLDHHLSDEECYFDGDKRMHRYGTVFHPYVMPFGYQKCAVCSCSTDEAGVVCAQLPCPGLPCSSSDAVRLHPDDCCQVCPNGSSIQQEQSLPDTPLTSILNIQTSCTYRNKIYTDGSSWHPQLASFDSPENCVRCLCTAGKVSCAREQCEEVSCDIAKQVKSPGQCCTRCIDS